MRVILTFLIVFLTSAVGSVVFILQSEQYRHLLIPEEVVLVGKNAFNFDPLKIRKILVHSSEGTKAEFVYRDNQWYATFPWDDRADNLGPLINFAMSTVIQKSIPIEEANAETFGFNKESQHIQMFDVDGNNIVDFDLGLSSAWNVKMEGSEKKFPCVYIRRRSDGDGAPTLLCTDPQFKTLALFENNLVRFRNYYLNNPFDIPRLREISITRKNSVLQLSRLLERSETGKFIPTRSDWTVEKPLNERVNQDAAQKLINSLTYLSARNLLSPKGINLPEEDPDKIQIKHTYFNKAEPVTITIYPSTKKNNLVLATASDRENVIFQIPSKQEKKEEITYLSLPTNVNDVRAKSLLRLEPRNLKFIILKSSKNKEVKLEKTDRWNLWSEQNKATPANTDALTNLITVLSKNTIIDFVSDAPNDLVQYGLELGKSIEDRPSLILVLLDKYGNQQILYFGKTKQIQNDGIIKTGIYVKDKEKNSVWIVDAMILAKIPTDTWSWKPLNLFKVGISSIKQIKRLREKKPTQFIDFDFGADRLHVYEGENPIMKENPEVTHRIDITKAAFFIKTLSSLSISNRVNPKLKEAREALDKRAFMQLIYTYEDYNTNSDKTIELTFAPVADLSSSQFFYVSESNSDEIFEIERKTCEDLFSSIKYEN